MKRLPSICKEVCWVRLKKTAPRYLPDVPHLQMGTRDVPVQTATTGLSQIVKTKTPRPALCDKSRRRRREKTFAHLELFHRHGRTHLRDTFGEVSVEAFNVDVSPDVADLASNLLRCRHHWQQGRMANQGFMTDGGRSVKIYSSSCDPWSNCTGRLPGGREGGGIRVDVLLQLLRLGHDTLQIPAEKIFTCEQELAQSLTKDSLAGINLARRHFDPFMFSIHC